mmetsp:Transcript_22839/g.58167  ORF Transcript_22839/g.58167 Transcript_22839/m.58167 type:complete len:235 (+) Transcript_22839:338-1042(+)
MEQLHVLVQHELVREKLWEGAAQGCPAERLHDTAGLPVCTRLNKRPPHVARAHLLEAGLLGLGVRCMRGGGGDEQPGCVVHGVEHHEGARVHQRHQGRSHRVDRLCSVPPCCLGVHFHWWCLMVLCVRVDDLESFHAHDPPEEGIWLYTAAHTASNGCMRHHKRSLSTLSVPFIQLHTALYLSRERQCCILPPALVLAHGVKYLSDERRSCVYNGCGCCGIELRLLGERCAVYN